MANDLIPEDVRQFIVDKIDSVAELEGLLLGLSQGSNENEPIFYLVRLVSYILILIAIVDKNRINKSQGSG